MYTQKEDFDSPPIVVQPTSISFPEVSVIDIPQIFAPPVPEEIPEGQWTMLGKNIGENVIFLFKSLIVLVPLIFEILLAVVYFFFCCCLCNGCTPDNNKRTIKVHFNLNVFALSSSNKKRVSSFNRNINLLYLIFLPFVYLFVLIDIIFSVTLGWLRALCGAVNRNSGRSHLAVSIRILGSICNPSGDTSNNSMQADLRTEDICCNNVYFVPVFTPGLHHNLTCCFVSCDCHGGLCGDGGQCECGHCHHCCDCSDCDCGQCDCSDCDCSGCDCDCSGCI